MERILILLCCLLPCLSAANAAPPPLAPVPFRALNEAASPIGCGATLAHWYSVDLGHADRGDTIAAMFWSDPASGTLYSLNASGARMPVQQIRCFLAGRPESTGSVVLVQRRAGHAEPKLLLACAAAAGRLRCRSVNG